MTTQELLENILEKEKLKPKDRLKIPQQFPSVADPSVRAKNQEEVSLNYTITQARIEAHRCLQCKNKPCVSGCPVGIDIPGFIKEIAEGNMENAIRIIKNTSLLPAVCGRVCPQEKQCQLPCVVGKSLKDVEKSVGIGKLERFVADWERENGSIKVPEVKAETGKKVAVVGSGPAGLVLAADVRREGHSVTLFEAFHKLGGVMRYGIPEFRLPNKIVDTEIQTLKSMGVIIQKDFIVGRTKTIDQLLNEDHFDAVFIGTGAGLPVFMNVPGEDLVGVFAANEYLTRANLMRGYSKDSATPVYKAKKVAVIGGGNVAMDSARMALRLGAEQVKIIYRRSIEQMPARREEIHHAREEGVIFDLLTNLYEIHGDDEGRVKSMTLLKYELGEPDDSGRRKPILIENSNYEEEVDCVIMAIGNGSNPLIKKTTANLNTNKWGNIIVDKSTGETSIDKVYAGGDIVLGSATVILAMGEGRKAAAAINRRLSC